MTVHLLKLCVGVSSVDELKDIVADRAAERLASGLEPASWAKTRMAPKRADEVIDGGSLYWVIKGAIQARQPVLSIEPFTDASGIGRYQIFLAPVVTPVRPRPCRPFQGWRYLREGDAPADFVIGELDDQMPAQMRRELMELCLI
ncbi:DUF1489 domain-containing protein [Acuticoccus sp. M5D2P5]|uniref:DUF1489 family protein n=1 Tax=Acuticoccus kalidii TaxID=2910977 RepID=UPI001F2BD661|nr:DUF1489 domain-containing protein [Acuticoccus kalidii]MCF3935747.1 DUF1489 domain-containing protein [Acuticoccus kalidii]